ncbi:hypothetical protein AG1IA_06843 [Rhizoctonia solani AG-1 IA]|uniref:Uncharacterized protein n=1 Tax=Thanatephorus cucumeris (strain AG1-IA) TaxID=983506 RepID=L8WRW8_THACA|nr:hypothetical protein AG1IA_06843 [Rhizoctonia solani AG-1 IA]
MHYKPYCRTGICLSPSSRDLHTSYKNDKSSASSCFNVSKTKQNKTGKKETLWDESENKNRWA